MVEQRVRERNIGKLSFLKHYFIDSTISLGPYVVPYVTFTPKHPSQLTSLIAEKFSVTSTGGIVRVDTTETDQGLYHVGPF